MAKLSIHQSAEIMNALFCHFWLSIKSEEASGSHKNYYFVDLYGLSSIKIERNTIFTQFSKFYTVNKYYTYGLPFQITSLIGNILRNSCIKV